MQRLAKKTLFLTFIFSSLALTTAMAGNTNPMLPLGVDFSLTTQNGTPPVGGNASAYQTVTVDPTTAAVNYLTPVAGD